jgi:tRNA(fMet)-specific endonuclease VapC
LDNAVLLDTNIVSLVIKEAAVHDTRREKLNAMLRGKIAFISFVTVAELLYWGEKRGWGQKRKDDLDVRLRAFGVLDPTRDTAELWARTRAAANASGRTLQPHDLWIAAAALEHELPLVSDDGDFDQVGSLQRLPL